MYKGPRRLPIGTKYSEFSDKPLEADWFSWDVVDYGDDPSPAPTPTPKAPRQVKRRAGTTSVKTLLRACYPAFRVLRVILFLAILSAVGVVLGVMLVSLLFEIG